MLYKFQNDWNKNSKWLLTKKARQKMCTWKGTKKAKAEVKTTAKYIQFDAWARPKGVMLNRSRVNDSKCKTAY